MSDDITRLLERGAGDVRGDIDVGGIVRRGRRRRRTQAVATSVMPVVVAIALIVWLLPQPGRIDLAPADGGAGEVTWPVWLRYEVTRFVEGTEVTQTHELGAFSRDDWIHVIVDGANEGAARRTRGGQQGYGLIDVTGAPGEPFVALRRAAGAAQLRPVEHVGAERVTFEDLFGVRLGIADPSTTMESTTDSSLEQEVTADLGLDPRLVSARRFRDDCPEEVCDRLVRYETATLDGVDIPLARDRVVVADGVEQRSRMTVTELVSPTSLTARAPSDARRCPGTELTTSTGSADGLPVWPPLTPEQVSDRVLGDGDVVPGVDSRGQASVVSYDGETWRRGPDNTVVVSESTVTAIELVLPRPEDCPDAPLLSNGVPVLFRFARS